MVHIEGEDKTRYGLFTNRFSDLRQLLDSYLASDKASQTPTPLSFDLFALLK